MKKFVIIALCLVPVLLPVSPARAAEPEWQVLPIETFLAQQGRFCLDQDANPARECFLLDPPGRP